MTGAKSLNGRLGAMRPLACLLLLVVTACNSSDPPPSCQQAVTHYYGSGCYLVDISTTPPTNVPANDMIVECQSTSSHLPSGCGDVFDAWVECLGSTPANSSATSAQCDCSQEQQTMSRCINSH